MDVSTFYFQYFSLTPGVGGANYTGGALINNLELRTGWKVWVRAVIEEGRPTRRVTRARNRT